MSPFRLICTALIALSCGAAVKLKQQDDTQCLQKEHIKEKVNAVLASSEPSAAQTDSGCPPVRFIEPIRTRKDLGILLKDLGLHGVGVEVGVRRGAYTFETLSGWQIAQLYVQVDLWQQQSNYVDAANVKDAKQLQFMNDACSFGQQMKQNGSVGEIVQCKDFSTECAKLFPDASLDFVYVDARHDRKGVLEDMQVYWPKLKIGGIMAGHDYMEQYEVSQLQTDENWTVNGDGTIDTTGAVVRGAVNEFFKGVAPSSPPDLRACPRQPVITYRENAWNTWLVRK